MREEAAAIRKNAAAQNVCSVESVRGDPMIPDHMIPSAQRASLDPHPYG